MINAEVYCAVMDCTSYKKWWLNSEKTKNSSDRKEEANLLRTCSKLFIMVNEIFLGHAFKTFAPPGG